MIDSFDQCLQFLNYLAGLIKFQTFAPNEILNEGIYTVEGGP